MESPSSDRSELNELLASLDPVVLEGAFVFVSTSGSASVEGAVATVQEEEGTTSVLPQDVADRLGLGYDFVASWITLRVHSSLNAVGLTAAVSDALARRGISCNVLAGFHHDHLLVPSPRCNESLEILRGLAETAGST